MYKSTNNTEYYTYYFPYTYTMMILIYKWGPIKDKKLQLLMNRTVTKIYHNKI